MRCSGVRGAVSLVVAGLILGCGLAGFGQEQTDGWRTTPDHLPRRIEPEGRPVGTAQHPGSARRILHWRWCGHRWRAARRASRGDMGLGLPPLAGHW